MSLKSIRKSYSKFLNVLNDAGVKLNESQKADLDSFILAIESKMAQQKETAIRATKKVVTEHLESEYKKVFESIMKHQAENAEIASKLQKKITAINESKKIARKVNDYLELYVESVLPKKTVVDYDRLSKLERLHEQLKDMLVVDEEAVCAKKAELQESADSWKKAYETEIAKLRVKLNESMDKNLKLNKKIDSFKAMELLESKTKDLPDFEARQMKKRLAEATTTEIEKTFDSVLEKVKDEVKVEEKEEEACIEDEVKDIIKAEAEGCKAKDAKKKAPVEEKEEDDDSKAEETDECDDVNLSESEVIDQDLMKLWCSQAERY